MPFSSSRDHPEVAEPSGLTAVADSENERCVGEESPDGAVPEAAPGKMGRRIRITLSYDGTEFYGWQVQPNLPTIQAALHRVLKEIEIPAFDGDTPEYGEPKPEGSTVEAASVESGTLLASIKVDGSGRTDAGVHALGQVAAFHLRNPMPLENLHKVMNRRLPGSIRVVSVEEVDTTFHPRFDAIAKTYEYRILRTELCSPFERLYVYHYPYPLNEQKMTEYASLLEGEHDFTTFAASDEKDGLGYSKVRRIFSSRLTREGDRLIYRVTGSGFLKHMVRNIVGVLIEVGKGNITRASLVKRLEPGCGIPAGPTAPARGLFLVNVEYPKAGHIQQA